MDLPCQGTQKSRDYLRERIPALKLKHVSSARRRDHRNTSITYVAAMLSGYYISGIFFPMLKHRCIARPIFANGCSNYLTSGCADTYVLLTLHNQERPHFA